MATAAATVMGIAPADLNVSVLAKHFSEEPAAWTFLEAMRWPDGPVCPHCGAVDHAYYLAPKSADGERRTRKGTVSYRRLWKCAECRAPFSVLVGTIFEDTHIPISKWLLAFHMVCAGKNGVAALELSRTLGLNYRTAWFMAHRIRYVLARPDGPSLDKLSGAELEADETYIGGKHHGKRGRGAAGKVPVVALVERGGDVHAQVVANVDGASIGRVLAEQVAHPEQTVLFTDTLPVYAKPGQTFAAHETVNHGADEYAKDTPNGRAHINTAEGYFSQMKRGIDGTYHHVSAKHLHRYVAEYDYRYNTRKVKDGERTVRAIRQATGRRLVYEGAGASLVTPD